MATKLFLRNTTTNGIGSTYLDMLTTAGSGSSTAVVNSTASGTEIQWTTTAGGAVRQWISGRVPAGGFTLTSTDVSIWALESSMNNNVGGRYRVFKRAANGTETELGGGPFDDGVEFGTSNTEMTWTGNVTDTAFAENDRILVKFYITNVGTMAAGTNTLTYDAADGATGDSFFNIAETVVFKPEEDTPTIVLNTADATNFGTDTTPTLEFTGTDPDVTPDDIRYNVQIDTVNTFDSNAATLLDSYSESNSSAQTNLSSANATEVGQAFTSTGGTLGTVKFYIQGNASATGNAQAKLYAATGTVGTNATPTGAALATSDNVDVTTISSASFNLITFTFSGSNQVTMSNGTDYVIVIAYTATANALAVGIDNTSPTHAGNWVDKLAGSYQAFSTVDTVFYIYSPSSPRLDKTSGTDSGFANTVTGGDTDPFNSGEKVSFTVQAGDALPSGTYYWRARAKDPSGTNTYSSWPTTRTFTISAVFIPPRPYLVNQAVNRASTY